MAEPLRLSAPEDSTASRTAASRSRAAAGKRDKASVNLGNYVYLLENFVLIYGTKTAWDGVTRRLVPVDAMRLAYTSDAVKAWLNTPTRRMVRPEQLMFEPGAELPEPCINLFDGFAMQPRRDNCTALLQLLRYLCRDSARTPEDVAAVVHWVLCWLALPLQRPGTKLRTALVVHGPQGAGKNLFFEAIAAIYGAYALVVGQDQIEDKFNDWASRKLFLIGDEVVARQELYHQKNKLKSFVTGETIQINAKMLPLRTETNHCNVVFLSNESQPIAVESGDRRYCVVYTPGRDDSGLYTRAADCIRAGGREAFMQYLLDYPLGEFDAFTLPPLTSAKQDLIELGLRPEQRFIREWTQGYLPLPLGVCSTEQLYRAFRRWCGNTGERWPPAQEAFSKGAAKAGAGQLAVEAVKLKYPFNGRTWMRVWVPEGEAPADHEAIGSWAARRCQEFEDALGKFCLVEGGP